MILAKNFINQILLCFGLEVVGVLSDNLAKLSLDKTIISILDIFIEFLFVFSKDQILILV